MVGQTKIRINPSCLPMSQGPIDASIRERARGRQPGPKTARGERCDIFEATTKAAEFYERTHSLSGDRGVFQKPKEALRMWQILGRIRDLTSGKTNPIMTAGSLGSSMFLAGARRQDSPLNEKKDSHSEVCFSRPW